MTLSANMGVGLASGFGGAIKNQVTGNGGDLALVLILLCGASLLIAIYGSGLLFTHSKNKPSKLNAIHVTKYKITNNAK
jgi:hypothetical protein